MCGKNNVISDEVLELMVEGRYGAAAEKVLDHAEWVSTNAASDDDLEKSDSIAALYPILIGLRLNEELASGHELWNSKKRGNYSPLRLSTSLPRWIYNRFFMSVEA